MAEIRPLPGIRYNLEQVEDLSNVLAPPYDIISAEEQERLYARSPYNVVRLELGQTSPEDNADDNRYTRARADLDSWLKAGVLRADPRPSLYLHLHTFPYQGQNINRLALFARLRLHEWAEGVVLPHEDTLPKPKADRLQLMNACECNLSPIMVLYDDELVLAKLQSLVERCEPTATAVTEDGQEHRLWAIDDSESIEWISQRLATGPVFIADGHHRYETALHYRNELRQRVGQLPANHPANYVLAALFEFADPGLVILPTHRVVRGLDDSVLASLTRQLETEFQVEKWSGIGNDAAATVDVAMNRMAELMTTTHAFGVYERFTDTLYLVAIPKERALAVQAQHQASDAYKRLDVAVLHHLIMEPMLGIGSDVITAGQNVAYTRNASEAIEMVRTGDYQLAFLLNSTLPQQIRDVALASDRMPQKSTYFYPKLPTGLVINLLSRE